MLSLNPNGVCDNHLKIHPRGDFVVGPSLGWGVSCFTSLLPSFLPPSLPPAHVFYTCMCVCVSSFLPCVLPFLHALPSLAAFLHLRPSFMPLLPSIHSLPSFPSLASGTSSRNYWVVTPFFRCLSSFLPSFLPSFIERLPSFIFLPSLMSSSFIFLH